MQDVTDLPFMRVMQRFGGPDYYVTEYFRVHETSRLDRRILRSIDENPTGRPVFAQLIGQDLPSLVRTARELETHPVAGIDLNLGCPAPIVCRKNAGGGLLRSPGQVDRIVGTLRDAIAGWFTVKTRVGYHHHDEFDPLLEIFHRHAIDRLVIHGRTVAERYRTPIHPACIRRAVTTLSCPVMANGNVVNAATGMSLLARTAAAGLMIGRGAIRNPWIFDQVRVACGHSTRPPSPRGKDLLEYIHLLWDETSRDQSGTWIAAKQVQKMKRYLVYIAQGLDPEFEQRVRRAREEREFWDICHRFLDHGDPLPDVPPEGSRLFCGFRALLAPAEKIAPVP